MRQGYVKLYRDALDTGLLKNPNLWTFFTFLLLRASYSEQEAEVGKQSLQPGELILTRRNAMESLGFSSRTVRTCLTALQERGTITCKATNKYTLITVENWGTYQLGYKQNDQQNEKTTNKTTNKSGRDDQQNDQQNDQQKDEDLLVKPVSCTDDQHRERPAKRPTKRPTKEEKTTSKATSLRIYNQKEKEEKEGEENSPPPDFLAFWNAYPRKDNKYAALQAWQETNGKRPPLEVLLSALRRQANTAQWREDEGTYIPNPANWLKNHRWEDGAPAGTATARRWAEGTKRWAEGTKAQINEMTYVLDEYGTWRAEEQRGAIPANMMTNMIADGKAQILETKKVLH